MTENFKMELDVIKDNTNSQNFQITTQNSLSSSNKSNKIDNDITKSMNSFLRKQKLPPLSRNFYSSESEELYSKTKISASSSEIRTKNFPKKMSDQNSYQNQILVVNNSLSPTKKKKVSSFKMVEKSKYKKIFDANDFNARRVEQETITGKERKDAFALKGSWGAKLTPFAILIDDSGKAVKAFYSEVKECTAENIKRYMNNE